MKFGIVYYWRDPVEIFDLAQDFLELRVFENDVKDNFSTWKSKLDEILKYWDDDITIHSPEYFNHPDTGKLHLVDISSTDENQYRMSMDVMRSVFDFARSIDASKILIHPGGITPELEIEKHEAMIDKLQHSMVELSEMDFGGEILLENMPWFYWMSNKKRWTSNICVTKDDFIQLLDFCDGMVLDLSHGFLCSNRGSNKNLEDFAEAFRNRIHYLHVSDALPPDNEGMQIGEGNVNFSKIFNMLDKDELWIVPEIWKGHENFGKGFQIAIERIYNLI